MWIDMSSLIHTVPGTAAQHSQPRGVIMRMLAKLLLSILLFCIATPVPAQIHFTATLTGDQQDPVVTTSASGTGSFTLSDNFQRLTYVLTYQGLSGTLSAGGHFHTGRAGVNGPVVRDIAHSGDAASSSVQGVWSSTDGTQPLTPALVESLLTGRVYVNFHTTAHPGGEIRGQVNLVTSLLYVANLEAESGTTPAGAGGTGVFVLSPLRDRLSYRVTYHDLSGNLSGAGAHIHTGAEGVNGPIVKNIASGSGPSGNTVSGVWTTSDASQPLTSALVDSLIAGSLYANFHTSINPGGELRGQLELEDGIGFIASLDSTQEPNLSYSGGTGTGWVTLNDSRDEIRYAVSYVNLTDTLSAGGHFHVGGSGVSGPVVKNIGAHGDPASATFSGIWQFGDATQPLTNALVDSLLHGRMYMNFHTQENPSGEIRGQVDLATGIGFVAQLDGDHENPATGSPGRGTASIVLSADRASVIYSLTYFGLTGPLTAGGHFHTGAPGVSGGIVKNIAPGGSDSAATFTGGWTTVDASQPLTTAVVDSLIFGRVYTNFHTAAHPGGEIRGQVNFGSDAQVTSVRIPSRSLPSSFALEQNYPNPFNPVTNIEYAIEGAGGQGVSVVRLAVYDILGREVANLVNEPQAPGRYRVQFDGSRFASGIYFYRLQTGSFSQTRKLILEK
jgi:CHRD domain/Secretion system C-terminal sorting domain